MALAGESPRCRRLCDSAASARTLLGTGQCGGHSPLCPATHFGVNRLINWPCRRWQRVGVRACQAQSASTQRHCSDIGDNAIMCLGDLAPLGAWEPGTGRERQSSRPLHHCSIAPQAAGAGARTPLELPGGTRPGSGGGGASGAERARGGGDAAAAREESLGTLGPKLRMDGGEMYAPCARPRWGRAAAIPRRAGPIRPGLARFGRCGFGARGLRGPRTQLRAGAAHGPARRGRAGAVHESADRVRAGQC